MAEVLSLEARLQTYLEVEVALASAQADLGVIPAEAAVAIDRAARDLSIDVDRFLAGTRLVGYPILPLLDQLREAGGPDVAGYAHWGATTQDIMDSGLALQMRRGLDRIETLLIELGDGLARLAEAERATVIAGRTHAQPAVPTTFGAKTAVWLAECARHLDRVRRARMSGGDGLAVRGGGDERRPGSAVTRNAPCRGRTTRAGGDRRSVARRARQPGRCRHRPRRAGSHRRQDRARGHRAVTARDRRAVRSGRPPPRRVLDDAAEGKSDLERDPRRVPGARGDAAPGATGHDPGDARALGRRVADRVGRRPAPVRLWRGLARDSRAPDRRPAARSRPDGRQPDPRRRDDHGRGRDDRPGADRRPRTGARHRVCRLP